MKKLFCLILFVSLFAGCEKNDEALNSIYPKYVYVDNPTKYYANIEIYAISSISRFDPETCWKIDTYKKLCGEWVCIIGEPCTITMSELTPTGYVYLYYYTCLVTDTIHIDSTQFKILSK